MKRFNSSIATLEAAIKHLTDYMAEIDGVPHPLHVVEARTLALIIALGLAALGRYVFLRTYPFSPSADDTVGTGQVCGVERQFRPERERVGVARGDDFASRPRSSR